MWLNAPMVARSPGRKCFENSVTADSMRSATRETLGLSSTISAIVIGCVPAAKTSIATGFVSS